MNQMGYPTHPYGSYHSLAQIGGIGGAMMTSHTAMMGQQSGLMGAQGVMAQPGGIGSSPYMRGMTQGMMGQQQQGGMMVQQQAGMMGHQQVGGSASVPQQQAYGGHQWNIAQVCVSLWTKQLSQQCCC